MRNRSRPDWKTSERFLIADDGKAKIFWEDPESDERLDAKDRDQLFLHAVRDLGWIEVYRCEWTPAIDLTFDPRQVREPALSRAGMVLLKNPRAEVTVRVWSPRGWREHHYSSGTEAAQALMTLPQDGYDEAAEDLIHNAEKNPRELLKARDRRLPLAKLLDCWVDCGGQLSQGVFELLHREKLMDRAMIMEPSDYTPSGVFGFIGEDFTLYGPNWPHTAIGEPIVMQPDPVFGRWVGQAFVRLQKHFEPQYLHVNARIRKSGDQPPRSAYWCLRLPWQSRGGERLVMTASVMELG